MRCWFRPGGVHQPEADARRATTSPPTGAAHHRREPAHDHGSGTARPQPRPLAGYAALWTVIEARLLSSNEALAYAVIILPALVVFAVVFFLVRRSLARRGTHWRAFAFPVLAALALAIGVPKAAAYAFPDPMQRFERELGGSGRCLGNSLYASRDAFPARRL
ncbi:hypothetical protein GCM10020000_86260 [Streptomyces olivoverticillatus]